MNNHNDVYPNLDEDGQRGLNYISRGTAILLLAVYVAYLIFQLKTHTSFFKHGEADEGAEVMEEEEIPRMSTAAGALG